MGKREAFWDLVLSPKKHNERLGEWLVREIKDMILSHRLKPESRLPSTRRIAKEYFLSRGTVVLAFEQLIAEGYLKSRQGSGFYVSSELPDDYFKSENLTIKTKNNHALRTSELAKRISKDKIFQLFKPPNAGKAFRPNQPDLNSFPIELWARLNARQLRRISSVQLANSDVAGYLPLRKAICEYIASTRGIVCIPEQIAIVSGTQQAFDIVSRLVLNRGDKVWIENPGYPGAKAILESIEAHLVPIPVDENGLNVEAGLRLAPDAKLVYTTPAHQFPLGSTLSLERRLTILSWARKTGSWIFEDDYDSEYRFKSKPLAALKSIDDSGCVVYAGTFNKMLFPALRLGYVVLPEAHVDTFLKIKSQMDRYTHSVDQIVLCDFINEGHFGRHIRKMRELYHQRLKTLLGFRRGPIAQWLDIKSTDGGLQTIAWLKNGLNDIDVSEAAKLVGVETMPISQFGIKTRYKDGLLLGFAAVTESEIKLGIEKMTRLFRNL